jgi:hypothetical protein
VFQAPLGFRFSKSPDLSRRVGTPQLRSIPAPAEPKKLKHPEPVEECYVRVKAPAGIGAVQTFSNPSHRRCGRHRRDVSGGCRVFDPCWLDQARRLKLRRHSSTPPDAASQVPKLCEPRVGSAPRETSGTEGSNPSPSSEESAANLWLCRSVPTRRSVRGRRR